MREIFTQTNDNNNDNSKNKEESENSKEMNVQMSGNDQGTFLNGVGNYIFMWNIRSSGHHNTDTKRTYRSRALRIPEYYGNRLYSIMDPTTCKCKLCEFCVKLFKILIC